MPTWITLMTSRTTKRIYLTAPPLAARHVRMERPQPRTELKRNDRRVITVFQERMLEVLHQLLPPESNQKDAELDMECLTQFRVQLVKEVTDESKPSGRRSTTYKDCYSPEFMLCKWNLCLIISLKRHMCGLHGKKKLGITPSTLNRAALHVCNITTAWSWYGND